MKNRHTHIIIYVAIFKYLLLCQHLQCLHLSLLVLYLNSGFIIFFFFLLFVCVFAPFHWLHCTLTHSQFSHPHESKLFGVNVMSRYICLVKFIYLVFPTVFHSLYTLFSFFGSLYRNVGCDGEHDLFKSNPNANREVKNSGTHIRTH